MGVEAAGGGGGEPAAFSEGVNWNSCYCQAAKEVACHLLTAIGVNLNEDVQGLR